MGYYSKKIATSRVVPPAPSGGGGGNPDLVPPLAEIGPHHENAGTTSKSVSFNAFTGGSGSHTVTGSLIKPGGSPATLSGTGLSYTINNMRDGESYRLTAYATDDGDGQKAQTSVVVSVEQAVTTTPPFQMVSGDLTWKTHISVDSLSNVDMANQVSALPLLAPSSAYGSIKITDATSDSYIDTGVDIGNTTDTTISIWVKTSENDGTIMSTDEGGYDWTLGMDNGNWRFANGSNWHNTNIAYIHDQWYHLSAVFDVAASTLYFYIDGVQVWTKSITTDVNTGSWYIGRSPHYAANRFEGEVAGVTIWDKALTGPEITDIYGGGYTFDVTTNSGNYASSADVLSHIKRGEIPNSRGYNKNPDTGEETPLGAEAALQTLDMPVDTGNTVIGPQTFLGTSVP